MDLLIGVGVGLAFLIGIPYFMGRHERAIEAEEKANEHHSAPSRHQLRWHIRHIRQDVALIAKLLMLIAGLLAGIVISSAMK